MTRKSYVRIQDLKRKNHKGDHSKDMCFEALEDIKEIRLYYDDKGPPEVLITQMSVLQRKLFNILDLKRFTGK